MFFNSQVLFWVSGYYRGMLWHWAKSLSVVYKAPLLESLNTNMAVYGTKRIIMVLKAGTSTLLTSFCVTFNDLILKELASRSVYGSLPKTLPNTPPRNASPRLTSMCQSVQPEYVFCGCLGATYQQKCANPCSTCAPLLARPSPLKLQCYCSKHASQAFKSRRGDERERRHIDKEYQRILQRKRLQEESAQARKEVERREREIEALKYEEFLAQDRRKEEEYRRRKAEKKAGLRPGIRQKSDGICLVM